MYLYVSQTSASADPLTLIKLFNVGQAFYLIASDKKISISDCLQYFAWRKVLNTPSRIGSNRKEEVSKRQG